MRAALIGHTGFIGGNLVRQTTFTDCFHSADIGQIAGREFDLLVCSGVSAVKWWANKNAEVDLSRIDNLLGYLARVQAKRLFIISTVDVYPVSSGINETFNCHAADNHAYGKNRLYFEDEVLRRFPHAMIARLGGVFGDGLKKKYNF